MNYATWLRQAGKRLKASDSPKRDGEILLGFVTGKARSFIIAFGETELTPSEQQQLTTLLQRRVEGEPIAYLVGEREFWSLPLQVSPVTLIPRPDTERLVELALQRIADDDGAEILDLGSGSGAVALALAKERPHCMVTGVDCDPASVVLARSNGQRLALANVQFLVSNWFSALAGRQFVLIVGNPPYIDRQDPHLQQGDVRFEPRRALVAEQQGLADLCLIIKQAPGYLSAGGWLLLEHGWQQGSAVRQRLRQRGFSHITTCKDYAGNERVTMGQLMEYI